ncbi:DUF3987 domain-containing protein [Enterobacter hormaechei]|nr:DUF3987 domain-containing protein [Enterobacter hormaechei]
MPVGLYVVSEQPSGMGKSAVINAILRPFYIELNNHAAARRKARGEKLATLKDESGKALPKAAIEAIMAEMPQPPITPVVDATLQALESKMAAAQGGLFSLVGAEQITANTALGIGAEKQTNAAFLNVGFDGDHFSSLRVERVGVSGQIHGSIVIFAQDGLLDNIVTVSAGSGLAERVRYVIEPSTKGSRVFGVNKARADLSLVANLVHVVSSDLPDFFDLQKLEPVKWSEAALSLIDDYSNAVEPMIGDGGKWGDPLIANTVSKGRQNIIKMATNLTILRKMQGELTGHIPAVDLDDVRCAIEMERWLMDHHYQNLVATDKIGLSAGLNAVLAYFDRREGAYGTKTLCQNLKNTKPFKGARKANDLIRATLEEAKVLGYLTALPLQGGEKYYRLNKRK